MKYFSLLSATATDSLSKSSSCFFDSFTICIFVHGPFFNHSSADSPSVLYKISDDSVQVRCEDGLLLIVVVKGLVFFVASKRKITLLLWNWIFGICSSNYCDLKLYDDRVTSVTLSISEDSWDFIQIYDVLHHVVSIRSQIKKWVFAHLLYSGHSIFYSWEVNYCKGTARCGQMKLEEYRQVES